MPRPPPPDLGTLVPNVPLTFTNFVLWLNIYSLLPKLIEAKILSLAAKVVQKWLKVLNTNQIYFLVLYYVDKEKTKLSLNCYGMMITEELFACFYSWLQVEVIPENS